MDGSPHRDYAHRLVSLQDARWKVLLDVQRPYRWNITRHCVGRVLEVGCGTGRNLRNLAGAGVGVDINPVAVELARAKGYVAYTPDEFRVSPDGMAGSYDAMLVAHVLEHMDADDALAMLSGYLPFVRPGGVVMLICPQERGYASDITHVRWVDFDALRKTAEALGLEISQTYSFPFPRWAGRAFIYNEFVLVARVPNR